MKKIFLLVAAVAFLTGCGTTGKMSPLSVSHPPIVTVANKKTGAIFVKTFTLARKQDPKLGKAIGSVPWAGGPGLNW